MFPGFCSKLKISSLFLQTDGSLSSCSIFFLFLLFKFYLKLPFQIETTLFAVAIDIRIDHRIYVLKNVFVLSNVFAQFFIICFILAHKLPNDISYVWMKHIFSVQVAKVFLFAGKLVKFLRHTIFPKHIDCFVLALVSDFSFQRKQIEISRYQNIRIKAKVSGENVQTIYTLLYAMLDRKFLALSLVVVYGFKITFFSTALLF